MTRGGARPALVVLAASAAAACATVAPPVSKLPDGSYHIACTAKTLSSCLEAFETICSWHGYDVVSGSERRHRADLREAGNDTVDSDAQVRCKPGEALFGGAPATPAPPPPAPPPAAPAPPPAPTVEPPATAGPEASCMVPAADGGAPPCAPR